MIGRNSSEIALKSGQVMVYTAGFPCQPYSMLSSTRRMLGDANASQLWAVLANIRDTRPMVSNLQVM
jgi:site-specific DNA-cytosine methylase